MKKKNNSRTGTAKKPLLQKKKGISICSNADCKLRKGGCRGFEACPGYISK